MLSATITGIVSTDKTEVSVTTLDATPVSLPYFAENITVLFALGTDAEIRHAVRRTPVTPQRRNTASIISGNAISLSKATR